VNDWNLDDERLLPFFAVSKGKTLDNITAILSQEQINEQECIQKNVKTVAICHGTLLKTVIIGEAVNFSLS